MQRACVRADHVVFAPARPLSQEFLASTKNLLCAMDNTTYVNTTQCDSLLTPRAFQPSNVKRYALVYHLFGLLWTNAFIQVRTACSQQPVLRVLAALEYEY